MITTSWRITLLVLVVLIALCGCAEDGSCMGMGICDEEPACEGVCGDGVLDPSEECDDGNNDDGDGCSADCKLEIDGELPPTLASIQETIFTPICVACHYETGPAPFPLTDEETSYSYLVDVGSILCGFGTDRVEPGAPDDSCLVQKIEGAPTISGQRMPPPPLAPLEQEQIDQIRQWILDGALP